MDRQFSRFGLALVLLVAMPAGVLAQGDKDLARASQNPVSDMISLPIQNNTNFNVGPSSATQNITNIQPVIPFALDDDWNVITRTILPIVSQPGLTLGQGRVNGVGDATFTAFLSPRAASKVIWGVGPVVLLPTASNDRLGSDKWGVGPSAVVLTMPGNWVIGSLVSNIWSTGGAGAQDVNSFTWQYFVNYNMENGWYLTSAPIITANWEAPSDNRWTVPFGGGVGKIFRIGKQALNGQISAYYNAKAPDNAADWQLRAQLQFLFPK